MDGLQLIAKLQVLPIEILQKQVVMEGCDCDAECEGISTADGDIYLRRVPVEND